MVSSKMALPASADYNKHRRCLTELAEALTELDASKTVSRLREFEELTSSWKPCFHDLNIYLVLTSTIGRLNTSWHTLKSLMFSQHNDPMITALDAIMRTKNTNIHYS